jgi:PleD family two-component response regulator
VSSSTPLAWRRILIIDDNASIHLDFRKVLGAQAEHSAQAALDVLEANLFGETAVAAVRPNFEIDSAHQGQEGVAMAGQALAEGRPYAMAFVDMRMPPGWDGLKTIEHLWATDPDVQVVICSAHTDYDWTEVVARLGHSDKLLVLRKPAEPIEVLQCATALSRKWENDRLVRDQMLRLEEVITTRTRGLEAANQQLRHLATHDPLTGLPNRVLLDDRLHQAIAHADRDMRAFAVLVCDLDRFKLINDSLGHRKRRRTAGGRAAPSTAVRTADTVARFGGDELAPSAPPPTPTMLRGWRRGSGVLQAPVRIAAIDIHYFAQHRHRLYPDDVKPAARGA